MTGHRSESALTLILAGLLLPVSGGALAEIYPVEELRPPAATSEPGLAAFYRVAPGGELVIEDPLASGFAVDSTASHDSTQRSAGRRGRAGVRYLLARPQLPRIRIDIVRPSRVDASAADFEAFRCERYGFFYSSRGACVLPAFNRVRGFAAAQPRRGVAIPAWH